MRSIGNAQLALSNTVVGQRGELGGGGGDVANIAFAPDGRVQSEAK